MKLIIIGNGMDIDHNMKTKWSDIFTNDVMKDVFSSSEKLGILSAKDEYDLWSDFEKGIQEMVDEWLLSFTDRYTNNKLRQKLIIAFKKWKSITKPLLRDGKLDDRKGDIAFAEVTKSERILLEDKTELLFNTLIIGIKNALNQHDFKHKEKYNSIFNGDYHIINYNYTEAYLDLIDYSYCFFLHGKIDSETPLMDISENMQPKWTPDIQFGKYNTFKSSITSDSISEEIATTTEDLYLLGELRGRVGDTKIYFKKGKAFKPLERNQPGTAKWIETIKGSNYNELIVIGHSLDHDDISNFYEKCNMEKHTFKKATLITYYDKDDENLRKSLMSQMSRLFNLSCDINVLNNAEEWGSKC